MVKSLLYLVGAVIELRSQLEDSVQDGDDELYIAKLQTELHEAEQHLKQRIVLEDDSLRSLKELATLLRFYKDGYPDWEARALEVHQETTR